MKVISDGLEIADRYYGEKKDERVIYRRRCSRYNIFISIYNIIPAHPPEIGNQHCNLRYLRVQYLGSSVESPHSLTLLQYRFSGTHRPFSQENSEILQAALGAGFDAVRVGPARHTISATSVTMPEAIRPVGSIKKQTGKE
ncbi:hypothetical protein QE152_g1957 [Popillia japonica]|uniref:Uncharacterized protein n=1 Tax=Popillia japonica TaxID=7064 RepID=A0AAW1N4U8_POPJA